MNNRINTILLLLCAMLASSCGDNRKTTTAQHSPEQHSSEMHPEEPQENIIGELSKSPRHHEWVTLKNGDREFQAFVAYPEAKTKTKSIIVIHENRGLDDWARLFTDKLAKEGYLVIAPDFISNTAEGKKRTTDFDNPDAARDAIYALSPEQVTGDLEAAYAYIGKDASSTGEVAVIGFCWGGSQAFRYATNNQDLSSAHVFYGTAPKDAEALAKITSPVYGYYGGDDNRVNATIEETEISMKNANNLFLYEIYEGAGHAFMKSGIRPDAKEENKEAHDAAWERLLNLLEQN